MMAGRGPRFGSAAFFGVCLLLLAGCAANAGPVMEKSTKKLVSYFEAKQQLATTLQQQLGGTTGSNIYRLVAINGPAYGVGALISPDNSLDLESRACMLEPDALPPAEAWGSLPSWSSSSNLDIGLGIPAFIRGVFNKAESSLDAGLNWSNESLYQIADIQQTFLSKDEMRQILTSPECRAAINAVETREVIFVRGIVSGQESLRSARGFGAGLDVKLVEGASGDFHLKHDRSGAFELTDDRALPKFAIVARIVNPKWVGIKMEQPEPMPAPMGTKWDEKDLAEQSVLRAEFDWDIGLQLSPVTDEQLAAMAQP